MNKSRRQFIKNSLIGASVIGLAPMYSSCVTSSARLTILHTNDVHSHIDPFPASHSRWPSQGGFARRAALIKQIRQEQEHVLLLDCGDIFQGTPYFNIYKGKLEIDLMNKMGYDVATLGNHEFDNGIEALASLMKRADFSMVCSNYDFKNTALEGLTLPSLIINKGPIKIGIIGLGIELNGLVNPNAYKETEYYNPIEIANSMAQKLKQEDSCNLVIVVSHLGYKYLNNKVSDCIVAQESRYIDMILGGHTHTFMDKPDRIKNMNNEEVIVSQAGWGGIYLGRLDIELQSSNKKSATILNSIYHV